MKRFAIILCILVSALSCGQQSDNPGDFTREELSLIGNASDIMRVLTIEDSADSSILRTKSIDLSARALMSDDYSRLERLMVATVTDPSQDGVGIAGPQVGLNRRVIAVQRFDKNGAPFEVYPNIRIVWSSFEKAQGPEGCLSVPGRRGKVLRSSEIVVEYADLEALREGYVDGEYINIDGCIGCPYSEDPDSDGCIGCKKGDLPTKRDTVKGFTAVIFQHEVDHLDGILYIDRLD